MKPAISLQNVSKKYKRHKSGSYIALRDVLNQALKNPFKTKSTGDADFWALTNISLDIEQGDRVGIIGHNGAGKSTLLKIISRITPPTTGKIILEGRVASLLEVGTGFHPELTGRENIYLNGSILGLKRREIDNRLDEIIDFSGVENFIDMPLKQYSSGMQMRLAFSVAAHLEAEILLIDEVLAVGDMEFQKKCIGKMEQVSLEKGKTILFVSHNIGFIQSFCAKAILLGNGKVITIGGVDEVLNTYIQTTNVKNASKKIIGSYQAELIEFNTKNGSTLSNQFLLGYTSIFTMKFKALAALNNIELAFNIKNMYTELITHITNLDKQFPISVKKNEEIVVEVELCQLNLTPGTYKIDVFILNNGEMCWGCYDFEEITVLNSDKALRANGFPPHVKTFTDTRWHIKSL